MTEELSPFTLELAHFLWDRHGAGSYESTHALWETEAAVIIQLFVNARPNKKEHRKDCYMLTIGRECNCGAGDYNQCSTDMLKPFVNKEKL